ncbi:MAG: hypothetical protein ACK480_04080 [Planctomycetota bacterium]|jgi:hypothetical protein|nr:hypothetical protein [Planctomycetaceae bacterium]
MAKSAGLSAYDKQDSSMNIEQDPLAMHESQGCASLKTGVLVARWTFKGLLGRVFGGQSGPSDWCD